MAENFSAVTKQLIEDRKLRQAELEVQKNLLEKMGKELESAGMKAEDNAEYNKKSLELDKQQLKFRLKGADSPSARKEIKSEQAAAAKKNQNLLQKMAGGITNLAKGWADAAKSKLKGAGKSLMTMLKGAAIAGLLVAVLAFLESKYWTDTKDFIVNKVVPMLVDFYENILKPIGVIFADYFVATWKNIKTLFSGLGDAFDLFAKGEWWEGIKTMVSSIGTFLGEQIDLILTAVWNVIATVFGLGKTDSVFGSIWGLLTDTYDSIVTWISTAWSNIKTTISTTWTNIKDSVVKVFTDVKDWFVGLWTWASDVAVSGWTNVKDWMQGVWDGVWGWFTKAWTWASDVAVGTWTTVKDFIQEKWDSVVGWFEGLWTWGKKAGATEEGGWSLKTFIDGAVLKVIGWVKSLFAWATSDEATDPAGFSISGMIKKVIKTVVGWVTGLFTWVSEAGKVDGEEWSLMTMIDAAIDKAIGWAKDIFTWGRATGETEEGDFSITTLISGLWEDIKTALSDIFPSLDDIKAMLPSLSDVKDTLLGLIGLGGRKDADAAGPAVQTPATGFQPGRGPAENAAGGWMSGGRPTMVGELGPELIFPATGGQVMNAQRTAQIQAAGLRRGAMGQGGGPSIVNAPVNTVNNSQSNTTVTSTELKHPNPLLASVNLAA